MKARSGSAVMFHYLPGQHGHVAEWHDTVHRPEIHGVVPGVFYSQDWVAPPTYIAARQQRLPMNGGEYLSMYWSETSPDQLALDNRAASQARRTAGSYHPFQDVVWSARLEGLNVQGRDSLGYDVDAVPLTPNRGLVLIVEQVADPAQVDLYADALRTVSVPDGLRLGLFSACFQFVQLEPPATSFSQFWFVDRADPLEAFAALREVRGSPRSAVRQPPVELIFAGPYQPIVPGHYDVYA